MREECPDSIVPLFSIAYPSICFLEVYVYKTSPIRISKARAGNHMTYTDILTSPYTRVTLRCEMNSSVVEPGTKQAFAQRVHRCAVLIL